MGESIPTAQVWGLSWRLDPCWVLKDRRWLVFPLLQINGDLMGWGRRQADAWAGTTRGRHRLHASTVAGTVCLCLPYEDKPQSLCGPGARVSTLGMRKGKYGAPSMGLVPALVPALCPISHISNLPPLKNTFGLVAGSGPCPQGRASCRKEDEDLSLRL